MPATDGQSLRQVKAKVRIKDEVRVKRTKGLEPDHPALGETSTMEKTEEDDQRVLTRVILQDLQGHQEVRPGDPQGPVIKTGKTQAGQSLPETPVAPKHLGVNRRQGSGQTKFAAST